MIDAELIQVKRVFKTSKGNFSFEVYRGFDDYWHVDIACNGKTIESYTKELVGDKFGFVSYCEDCYRNRLNINSTELKQLQALKWHITIDHDEKYNLTLSNLNTAKKTFKATLVNEADEHVSKTFDIQFYEHVEDIFWELFNELIQGV